MSRNIAEVLSRALFAIILALIAFAFGLDLVEQYAPYEVSRAIDVQIDTVLRLVTLG